MNIFIDTERLKQVAQVIADLPPCKYAHRLTADQVMIALAEHDIWPEVVRADVIIDPLRSEESIELAD